MKRYVTPVMRSGKHLARKLAAAGLVGCMALILAGCGASGYASDKAVAEEWAYDKNGSASSAPSMTEGAMSMESIEFEQGVDESVEVSDTSRKLIKTVNMDVETKEFDTMMDALQRRVAELGGYIENMDMYNGSSYSSYRSSRDATLTIRIPQRQLNNLLNTVSDIGNVVRSSENVEDVTLTYVDLESRRNALEVERDRLLELMGQAENIEDIIVIESRLSEVRYQIESMESQLRTFDNRVNYSTVYLTVSEVRELTPVEERTAWQRMGEGFVDSVEDVLDGLAEFGIWFVIHIPYLIVWALVIAVFTLIVWVIVKRYHKKTMRKMAQRQQMVAQAAQNKAQGDSVQNDDPQK
ncbi:MAG: DUF4349 domain-containing protein [Acetatifactor sp.]|nr:DUF4349 domain-containing protein [Acetatifactor sp.]